MSKGCYLLKEVSDGKRYLQEEEDGNLVNEIRKRSLTGRLCGDESFIEMLKQRFSRRLKPLPQGRSRKGKQRALSLFCLVDETEIDLLLDLAEGMILADPFLEVEPYIEQTALWFLLHSHLDQISLSGDWKCQHCSIIQGFALPDLGNRP